MPSCEIECYWLRCLVVQRGIVWWDGLTDLLCEVLGCCSKRQSIWRCSVHAIHVFPSQDVILKDLTTFHYQKSFVLFMKVLSTFHEQEN